MNVLTGAGAAAEMSRADRVLAALDPEQREVAQTVSGPLCVLAGAGTGKTRAITHRIAFGVHSGIYAPQQVLAVTFTARAAGELRTRLRDLGVGGVQARTFHAAALRQLGYFWPQVIGGAPPALIEHKAPLVADAAARLRLTVDRAAIRDLAAEVEWAKVSLLTPETYAASAGGRGLVAGFDTATVARLLERYEQAKTDRGVIDFEDVLLVTTGILIDHPDVAATVRSQYRHFVVDEYQDVNALQQQLLDAWLGDRDDLCVVGDPNQTIYSFTGASAQYLTGFKRRFPAARVVELVRDYRSTPEVVALANALAAPPAGGGGRLRLIAQQGPGPRPKITSHDDDIVEAVEVARAATDLIAQGVDAAEIAVLYRTNAQSQALEQALGEAGLPYLVRGGERFFSRKEVRDAMLLLRGAARSGESVTDDQPGVAIPLADQVRDVLAGVGWTPTAPTAGGAVRERWESLSALVALAEGLAATQPVAQLRDLVVELEERAAVQHAPTVQGITLASLHAAKGLEWEAVFLVGLSEGLMPISLAEGWQAVAEESRLLYVGVTRARRHLRLSWARSRTPGGRATRSVSRFLTTAPVAKVVEGAQTASSEFTSSDSKHRSAKPSGRRSASGRSKPLACSGCGGGLDTAAERKIGRCAQCPPTYDEGLFERLRTWRSDTATEAKVPAYVVFTDATLIAMAERRPRTAAELARIAGVGTTKLQRYGEQVLALIASE